MELDITVKGVDTLNAATNAMAEGAIKTKSLKAELRELQQELATIDPNTQKFQDLSQQAGELKDRMNDASEAVRASAGPAFEQLGNNASLLTQRLGSLDFEGAGQSVKALAGNIKGLKFGDLINGVKSFGGAMKALGTALLSNPIFLIIAALAAIGAALKMFLDGQRNDVDKANEAIMKSNEKRHTAEKKQLAEVAGDAKATYDLKRKFAEKDLADTEKQIKNLEKLNRSAYGLSEEQEQKLDELRKKYSEQRVDYEIMAIDRMKQLNASMLEYDKVISEAGLDQRGREKKSLEEWYASQREKIEAQGATEEEIYKLDWAYSIKKQELQDKNNKEDSDKRKAAAEKRKAEKEREDKDFLDAEKERRAKMFTATDELNKLIIDSELKTAELSFQIKESTFAKEAELLQAKKEQEMIMTEFTRRQNEARVALAQDAIGSLMALNDSLQNGSEKSARRAFEVNKGLSLAQAIMSTYQAVNAQLAVPQDAITGANWVKAGIALTAGLANVIKISKTKFQASGGGGSTGGGGSISAPSTGGGGSSGTGAPSFQALNTNFLQNRPNQSPTVQAYVVSGNVANELEARTKIKDKSRL